MTLDMNARGLCELGEWEFAPERDDEARRLTFRAYMRGQRRGRLFIPPEVYLRDALARERFARRYRWLPIGIVSLGSEEPCVGIGGYFGASALNSGDDYILRRYAGVTTHVWPGNIVFVHGLPHDFRRWLAYDR